MNEIQEIIDKVAHTDGSLRDIYIQNVTLNDWDRILQLLKKQYVLESDEDEIPSTVREIISICQERGFILKVYIGKGITANCHFFVLENDPSPIEFDLDPREINSPYGIRCVLEFISKLGDELNKNVNLTEENSENMVLLSYSPSKKMFFYLSSIGEYRSFKESLLHSSLSFQMLKQEEFKKE